MQETEIKVSFNDGGMMQQLQDMLTMLDDIQDRAGGVEMPTQGRPSPEAPPTERQQEEQRQRRGMVDLARDLTSGVAGKTAGGLLSQVSNEITNLGKAVGGFSGALIAAGGIFGSLKGQSLELRQQQIGEIINLEGLEAQLMGLTGESGKELGEALTGGLTQFGFSSAEARQLGIGTAQAFGRAIGGTDLQRNIEELAILQRTGISSQGVATLAGSIQQATGQGVQESFTKAFELTDLAEGLDLRGAGVDRFISSFSGIAEEFTRAGITFKPRELGKFARAVADATGQTGQRPMQIVQAFAGVAGRAGAGFMGNFSQLAEMAIQAKVFSEAGSPFEAFKGFEKMRTKPDLARQAIVEVFGGDSKNILASMEGIGTRDAGRLAVKGALSRDFRKGVARISTEDLIDTMQVTGAQAEADRKIIEEGRKAPDLLKEVIRVQGELKTTMLRFTDNETKITALLELMQKALEKIEQYTP
jgi:hypothetical protein